MNPLISTLAERIIRAAGREHPADSVLRQELKSQRGLEAGAASDISRAVFAYFRWLGWLDPNEPIASRVDRAVQLSRQFAVAPEEFPEADLIARAVPGWLKEEMEIPAAWARSLQAEPRLWLRARHGQGRAVMKKLGDCTPFGEGPLADALQYRGTKDLFRTPEFHAGDFELQDLSSQAIGLISNPRPGQTWWDACAGEGGKTLHLSALMENQGLIWCSDRAAWRLQTLKRRAARAEVFNYRVAPWDGGAKLPTRTKFDGVLIDAPCSGVGTWHRNPHARWTTTLRDVKELSEIQQRILAHAAAAVKPGGRLIYAVCTMTRTETQLVAEAFEAAFPEFERLPIQDPLKLAGSPVPDLRLWSQEFGGNGMFVASWKRRGT